MRRAPVVAVLALLASLVAPPAAPAAPGWVPAATVAGGGADAPTVAADANGNTLVTWFTPGGPVQFAVRPAGGSFGAPVALTGAGVTPQAAALDANPRGDAVAAWGATDPLTGSRIDVATGSVAGGLQLTSSLPESFTGDEPGEVVVGVDAAGGQVLAWLYDDGDDTRVRVARRAGSGDPFTVTDGFDAPGFASDLQLVVNPGGAALIGWLQTDEEIGPAIERVQTRVLVAALTPGAPPVVNTLADVEQETDVEEEITTGQAVSSPQVALDAAGGSAAAWRLENLAADPEDNRSVVQGGAGTGAAISATTLSPPGQDVSAPRLAFNDVGVGLLTWIGTALDDGGDPVSSAVYARPRAPGGAFGAPATVVQEDDPVERRPADVAAAVTPAGEGVLVFVVDDARGRPRCSAPRRRPAGSHRLKHSRKIPTWSSRRWSRTPRATSSPSGAPTRRPPPLPPR